MKVVKLLCIGLFASNLANAQLAKTSIPLPIHANGMVGAFAPAVKDIDIQVLKDGKVKLRGVEEMVFSNLTSHDILTKLPDILGLDISGLGLGNINDLVFSIYDKVEQTKKKVLEKGPVSLRVNVNSEHVDGVNVFVDKNNPTGKLTQGIKYDITNVQLKFEDEVIKHLVVSAEDSKGEVCTFINTVPIPVNSLDNLNKFWGKRALVKQGDSHNKKDFIFLNDVLRIHPQLQKHTGNLAPLNQIVNITKDEFDWAIPVRKKSIKQLFDARVYSDLFGLNEGVGNGLLQLEVKKKMILNTVPRDVNRNYEVVNEHIVLKNKFWYWGHFVQPMVSWNKLEGTDRALDLLTENRFTSADGDEYIVSNLELLNYASFQGGLEVNLGEMIMSSARFGISPYVYFRQTPVIQLDELSKVNSIAPGLKLFGVLQPESAYEGELSVGVERITGVGSDVFTVPNLDVLNSGAVVNSEASLLLRVCFTNTVRVSSSTSLFTRARFNFDLSSGSDNFYEVQLGTSFDIPMK